MTNTITRKIALTALSLGLAGAASMAAVQPASAAAPGPVPGQICYLSSPTQVYSAPGSNDRIYTLDVFRAVYIASGPYVASNGNSYWLGHGNGHVDGFMQADSRYYGCG